MTQGGTRPRARGTGTTSTRGESARGRAKEDKKTVPAKGAACQPATNGPAPSTIARPWRDNANIHPGQIIHDNTQHRRSSEQVIKDKAQAAVDTASAIKERKNLMKAKVQRLATAEDRIAQKDLEYIRNTARPDIREPVLPPKKRSRYQKGDELAINVRAFGLTPCQKAKAAGKRLRMTKVQAEIILIEPSGRVTRKVPMVLARVYQTHGIILIHPLSTVGPMDWLWKMSRVKSIGITKRRTLIW